MSDFKVAFKTRNVNSKRLFKEFRKTIEEVCDEYISRQTTLLDRTYNYEELETFLGMYLEDLLQNNVITQYNVLSDHRLNQQVDIHKGIIKVLVQFRQLHCLNVTEILMTFTLISHD